MSSESALNHTQTIHPHPSPGEVPGAVLDFNALETLSHVETDRFCDKCSYNLHGQPVRREPATGLLLARCPECGTFCCATDLASIGKVWSHRNRQAWMIGWVFIMIGLLVSNPFFFFFIQAGGATELRWMSSSNGGWRQNYTVTEIYTFAGILLGLAAMLGALWAALIVTFMPHWKKNAYILTFCIVPVAVTLFSHVFLPIVDLPALREHGTYILLAGFANLCGALLGGHFGRLISRWLVRVCLPAKLRHYFDVLWKVDGQSLTEA